MKPKGQWRLETSTPEHLIRCAHCDACQCSGRNHWTRCPYKAARYDGELEAEIVERNKASGRKR